MPSFGGPDAALLVVGLAPGLKGANFSGRPFTGDYAGELLYTTLREFGFAEGIYAARADDGLSLVNCRITNAVRCVPLQNKPEPGEIRNCGSFLTQEIAAMPNLKAVLSLGLVSHNAVLRVFGRKASAHKFAHGATHDLGHDRGRSITLFDSYHCSRYNTQTRRLTADMFRAVIRAVRENTG